MSENTSKWTKEKWKETTAALMRRAASDPAFREKCLADPRAAVKEISGLELHANTKIRFVEPADGIVLTLPVLRPTAELSDRELENVAGGPWESWYETHLKRWMC